MTIRGNARRADRRHVVAATIGALAAGGPAAAAAAAAPAAPVTLWDNPSHATIALAAGRTHVIGTRDTKTGGEVVEFKAGAAPRVLATFSGGVGQPAVGTDAAHHTVVVVSGCLSAKRAPNCPLSVIRLDTGARHALPHSTGAYAGDLDAGRAVVVRTSKAGPRILLSPRPGQAGTVVPTAAILNRHTYSGQVVGDSVFVTSIDLYRGMLAATVEYDADIGGGSALIQRRDGRDWHLDARSGYGEASGIPRVYRGVQVRSSGVRAFYDGGDNDRSFVARWSKTGRLVRKIGTDSAKVPPVDSGAAFDGDRLVVTSPYGFDCNPEGAVLQAGCAVRSFGPFRLG